MADHVLAWWTYDAAKPPFLLKYRSARWFILATICIVVFTDIFLYGLVYFFSAFLEWAQGAHHVQIVPVIPFALSERAGVREEDIQHWVSVLLAVYGAALLGASPLCGWLADKSPNRRLPLLVGLLALGGATVMLCVGNSIGMLVAGRLLQGFSAAVVWTVGLALLVDTVGQQEIGQVMGYVSLAMSLAVLVGPLLGGVVYARTGYYAVYYLAFGLIFFDILLRIALVEKKVALKWMPEATTGTSSSTSSPPTASSNRATPTETRSSTTMANSEKPPVERSRLPPILSLLGSRRLLAALWGCLVQASLLTAFDAVLPLRVQALFGFDSTGAGLIFLALVIPSFMAPLIGTLSDKYGPRWLTTFGFFLTWPLFILLRFVDHGGIRQIVLLCALLVMLGVSLTMAMTPLLAEITYLVAAKEEKRPGIFGEKGAYAQAYALFNTSFAGGTLIGPLWAGFISAQAGWGTMAWSLGLLSAVSAIPAVIWTGGLITRRREVGKRWNHGADERASKEQEGRV